MTRVKFIFVKECIYDETLVVEEDEVDEHLEESCGSACKGSLQRRAWGCQLRPGSPGPCGSSQDMGGQTASFRLAVSSAFWLRNSEFAHAF